MSAIRLLGLNDVHILTFFHFQLHYNFQKAFESVAGKTEFYDTFVRLHGNIHFHELEPTSSNEIDSSLREPTVQ